MLRSNVAAMLGPDGKSVGQRVLFVAGSMMHETLKKGENIGEKALHW